MFVGFSGRIWLAHYKLQRIPSGIRSVSQANCRTKLECSTEQMILKGRHSSFFFCDPFYF